jgi:subtilisin family serine protease
MLARSRLVRVAIGLFVCALVIVALAAIAAISETLYARDEKSAAQEPTHGETFALGGAEWVVELADGADPIEVAREHGCIYRGVQPGLRGFHRFEQLPLGARSGSRTLRSDAENSEGAVRWAEQQVPRKRDSRAPPALGRTADPLFAQQWHLEAAGVPGAWRDADGPRGAGVLISIVDDGLAYAHPDLAPRYVAAASRDVNGRRADPLPQNGATHGSEAAGVAAAAENTACGVGAAPRASLAGVRVIGAPASDADEAEALTAGLVLSGASADASANARGVSIYSCSWGPSDDARRLEGPLRLTQLALERGVREGRRGLGALYVWAAGNGAQYADRADYDAYASSRLTIAVGAVGRHHRNPWYSEPGAAVLVVAPSSDGIDSITTSRAPSGCTSSFGGTSAAAPLVAGILALALEVRPELSWRDAQHLLVRTSARNDAPHASWQLNGAGLWTSDQYGFGTVNASALVAAARAWPPVGAARLGETPLMNEFVTARPGDAVETRVAFAPDLVIEHVEVDVDVACEQRGALTLTLTSPSGTLSTFMAPHADTGRDVAWRFTSVRFWGESSRGAWTLRLSARPGASAATLRTWRLRFHGTT